MTDQGHCASDKCINFDAGRALVGAVIFAFFVLVDGMGMYVLANAGTFTHNDVVDGVLALVLFGPLFKLAVNWAMRRFFPLYRGERRISSPACTPLSQF